MHQNRLLAMLANALPEDISIDEIFELAPPQLWDRDPKLAAGQALSAHIRINWEAYLWRYPDVREAGIEPCRHFIENGIHENRKLASWHPLKQPERQYAPSISIIIPNYNNALFLRQCLESVCRQSLTDIEIIVVDDASTDDSLAILESFALHDLRLRIIRNTNNTGTYLARKKATLAASGRYLMYLDSDDRLDTNACKILYETISKGYDIVAYNFKFEIVSRDVQTSVETLQRQFSGGENRLYDNSEILEECFIKRSMRWNICDKIFLREIVFAALNDLPEGKFTMAEDVLTMAAIARLARNLYKIPDQLYYYNYGCGISVSDTSSADYHRYFNLAYTTKALHEYAAKYNLDIDFESINYMHCHASIWKWLNLVQDEELSQYYILLIEKYGFKTLLSVFVEHFSNLKTLPILANKLCKFISDSLLPEANDINHIGLIVDRNPHLIQSAALYAEHLASAGYRITVLGDEQLLHKNIHAEVSISGLLPSDGSYAAMHLHTDTLQKRIQNNKFDLIINMAESDKALLWDVLLLSHFNIPVIIYNDHDFSHNFMPGRDQYALTVREAAFRCSQAVICNSWLQELYLRIRGVNAWHIALAKDCAPSPTELISNFRFCSPSRKNEEMDYLSLLKYSAWYATHTPDQDGGII